ncbi:hypothetical protein VN97_g3202 [Penicillium thymicola]|uniref:Uncharacterized protein n=1 Tax=Penicillium thymicola TaxID=293382 RepID=A0AAI9TML6_PENTH|nr:hypothetical protein VN97_g3202 [Penicillium thymicola]
MYGRDPLYIKRVPWSSGMTTHCGCFKSVLAPVRFRVAPIFFFFPSIFNWVPWSSGMTTHCGYFNSVLAPVRFRVAPFFFFFFFPTLTHIIRRERVRGFMPKVVGNIRY